MILVIFMFVTIKMLPEAFCFLAVSAVNTMSYKLFVGFLPNLLLPCSWAQ